MSVKVKDILNLDIFNDIKIVTGQNGLNRTIQRVSVFDCPIESDVIDKNIIEQGDFFVTSLFVVKDSLEDMLKLIKILVESKASGVCVIDEYIDSFPDEFIELASKNSFPVFLADKDVPYADVIQGIMELIIKDKEDIISEMKIEKLLKEESYEEITKIAYDINNDFMKNLVVLYLSKFDSKNNYSYIYQNINKREMWSALKYKDGVLIIITNGESKQIQKQVNYILNLVNNTYQDYALGISDLYGDLKYLKKATIEAITSCEFSNVLNQNIVRYNQLGVYTILAVMKYKVELKEFYNKIVLPLKEYDKKYSLNLFETMVRFVDNDGNYEKTANEMFQHENTIRYRITKIKQILNMEEMNIEFLTQISIAVKIHKLLNEVEERQVIDKN